MSSNPVRIGVIGVGFGATVQIPGFQSEGAEVTAVCARRPERAQEAADRFGIPHAFTDYEEMVKADFIDAVSVVSPREPAPPNDYGCPERGQARAVREALCP